MTASLSQRPNPIRLQSGRPDALEEKLADLLAFVIPVSSVFLFSLGGKLPLGEIIMLLMLPAVLILRHKKVFQARYKWPYILMGVWLFSQVVTDFYVGTSPVNRARGMARIIFFAIDLAVISALVGTNLRRIKLFALGIAAMCIMNAIRTPEFGADTQWKMYLFLAFGIILFFFSSRSFARGRYGPVWISVILLTLTSVYFGSRSAALFSMVAAAPMVTRLMPSFGLPSTDRRQRILKLVALAVLTGAAAWATHEAIEIGVHSGIYSQGQEMKFKSQAGGKLGVLFGGRPEGPVAIQAIMDSPIIGHGSYANDPKYIIMLQDYRYKYGYTDKDTIEWSAIDNAPLIPAHSHLTMAWIDGGVLASFIWFYLLWVCGRSIVHLTDVFHPLAPLYCYLFITMFWDILFSPFGETRRMQEAFYIVLMFNLPKLKTMAKARSGGSLLERRPVYRRQIVRFTSPYRGLLPRPPRSH